jgi:hypothetical protein
MQEQPESQELQPAEPEPAYIDINQVESSTDTNQFEGPEHQSPEKSSEQSDFTGETPESSQDIQNQPVETEQPHEKPPIEIKEIQPKESQAPAEFTQISNDQNQPDPTEVKPESDQHQY